MWLVMSLYYTRSGDPKRLFQTLSMHMRRVRWQNDRGEAALGVLFYRNLPRIDPVMPSLQFSMFWMLYF